MKKFICILLLTALLIISFVACEQRNDDVQSPNIWDGSVATTFAEGDGSMASPFEVKTGAELALLAQNVNAGNAYDGQYFILKNDIDLNHIEWTPIGNGTNSFEGIFDGGEKTIKNMNISIGAFYNYYYTEDRAMVTYTAGFFGSCLDATIKNLNMTNSKIEIRVRDGEFTNQVQAGTLCGCFLTEQESFISNVKISDSDIVTNLKKSTLLGFYIGGAVGFAKNDSLSIGTYENMQTDISFSVINVDGLSYKSCIGGLFGGVYTSNICTVKNVNSSLTVNIDNAEAWYDKANVLGAFGVTQVEDKPFSITNMFSRVTIVQSCEDYFGYPVHQAHAAIGDLYYFAEKTATEPGYICQNVFGYVKQTDEINNDTQYIFTLYDLPDYFPHSKINCKGTESLPADHGFDLSVWDVSDLANPKLK